MYRHTHIYKQVCDGSGCGYVGGLYKNHDLFQTCLTVSEPTLSRTGSIQVRIWTHPHCNPYVIFMSIYFQHHLYSTLSARFRCFTGYMQHLLMENNVARWRFSSDTITVFVKLYVYHLLMTTHLIQDTNLLVGPKKERLNVNVALSNSFGFGGHNSSIIFAPYKQIFWVLIELERQQRYANALILAPRLSMLLGIMSLIIVFNFVMFHQTSFH